MIGRYMKKIGIQFHATHSEIIKLIKEIIKSSEVHFCIVSQNPFHATVISQENIETQKISEELNRIRDCFIYMSTKDFDIKFQSFSDFEKTNNCSTSILIGKQTNESLQESWFNFMGEEDGEYEMARKISILIRKMTFPGLTPFSPGQEKSTKVNKNFRYTIGAKNLYENGISLIGMVGISHFSIPNP